MVLLKIPKGSQKSYGICALGPMEFPIFYYNHQIYVYICHVWIIDLHSGHFWDFYVGKCYSTMEHLASGIWFLKPRAAASRSEAAEVGGAVANGWRR